MAQWLSNIFPFKADKKSAEGEDYSAGILSQSPLGYYYIHYQKQHEELSPALAKMLGLTRRRGFDDMLSAFESESLTKLKQLIEELRQGQTDLTLVLKTINAGQYLECHAVSAKDVEGKVESIALWFSDHSKSKSLQNRLERENEKLKTDLKQFSGILNALDFPVWRRAEDLSIKYCNLAFSEVAEESPEKVVESEELELYRNARNLAKQSQDSGNTKSERRHVIVSGQRKLFDVSEVPFAEDKSTVGFAVDVTEMEMLQEEMQRHISAQADLLESSTSAMAIYGADTRLKFFNYAFVALWKLDEHWLDTEPNYSEVLEVLREKRMLPEQANFPAFKQQQIRLFTDLIELQEEFLYLPNGKTLRVIAIPHALGGILFSYEDVTDRLALERSYNTLIAVQKATLDNLHEGVVVYGEDGRVKLCNPVFLNMWNLDQSTVGNGTHISEVLEATKSLYVFDDWSKFKQQAISDSHTRTVKRDRTERADGKVIDSIYIPLPDGATIVTSFDVTDSTLVERSLREKNEALQEADKLKSEFLANVSYELRSPLTSIIGFSDMLKQNYFGDLTQKQREYVEGIHQSSNYLMHLINDILDLASIEAGYMRLEVSQFDVYEMLSSMLVLIKERAKEFNISLKFECTAKIGRMVGDETRIRQAIFNLLNNAIKFTEEGGNITLGAKDDAKNYLLIWVEDDGIGIPPEEQDTVFGKFYKGSSTKAQKSGTGLGLPMVKSFIDLHGGGVSMQSELGKGTKITCRLPRNNPEFSEQIKGKTVSENE